MNEFYNKKTFQLQSRKDERFSENGLLINLYLHYLSMPEGYEYMQTSIALCRKRITKLHKNNIIVFNPLPLEFLHELPKEAQEMSHDNLTAIAASNRRNAQVLWKEIKRQCLKYDNINPPETFKEKLLNTRFLHPRDLIYYGYMAGSFWCKLLLPLLSIMMLITCFQKYKVRNGKKIIKTDGKLLSWLRCKSGNLTLTFWLCTFIIKHVSVFNSWKDVFAYYFKDPSHPINNMKESNYNDVFSANK